MARARRRGRRLSAKTVRYVHTMPGMQAEAAVQVAKLVRQGHDRDHQ